MNKQLKRQCVNCGEGARDYILTAMVERTDEGLCLCRRCYAVRVKAIIREAHKIKTEYTYL